MADGLARAREYAGRLTGLRRFRRRDIDTSSVRRDRPGGASWPPTSTPPATSPRRVSTDRMLLARRMTVFLQCHIDGAQLPALAARVTSSQCSQSRDAG